MSKYEALTRYLADRNELLVELTFDELDEIVGGLPESARKYQAYWANSRTSQAHSRAWLDAGRRAQFDIKRGCVRFRFDGPDGPDSVAANACQPVASGPERRIGLVGCVKSKRAVPVPAVHLYTSPLFDGRRSYVEKTCERWFVLSAEHGLVRPDQTIEPYDVSLKELPATAREQWSHKVLEQLAAELGELRQYTFEIHAGAAYREHGLVRELQAKGSQVVTPAAHLNRGEQLAFYADSSRMVSAPTVQSVDPPTAPSRTKSGWRDRIAAKLETAAAALRGRAQPRRAESPEIVPPPPSAPSGDKAAVAAALLDYGRRKAQEPVYLARDPEANAFLTTNGFAFLVGVLCDQGIVAERAWAAPLELRRRLGHWDLERMASEPDAIRVAFTNGKALHRMVETVPKWIAAAARRLLDEYAGDAANIWSDEPTASVLRARLDAFEGIGQKKAAMAVEILERDLGVPLTRLDGSDVAYDVHIRRVFLRAGLAERDDVQHMVEVARLLHPTRPGELDAPAWHIGRAWCRPTEPLCDSCPLTAVCPRLLSAADGVRTM